MEGDVVILGNVEHAKITGQNKVGRRMDKQFKATYLILNASIWNLIHGLSLPVLGVSKKGLHIEGRNRLSY